MRVLVVDDDQGLRRSLSLILGDAGHEVFQATTGLEGLAAAEEHHPEIILCDVRMPEMDGIEFLDRYKETDGTALIIMMTAYGSSELAIEAMMKGAYDYVPKPFGADEVLLTLRKAQEREQLRAEVGRLRAEVRSDRKFGEIIARSPLMVAALEVASKVARHPSAVLLTGASGTGKELVARLIHRESPRADAPFIPVNCGAIPDNLLESEFFGYMKGAFSGAESDKIGLLEAADGGTLFLDEIGELPLSLQVKLLRSFQEGEVRRVGGTETFQVDIRIISATNRDLETAVSDGDFRQDLYYRLAVVPIHLPPLRSRREEIPELTRYFLDRHGARLGLEIERITPEAMAVLLEYSWPGNIRELENVLERSMILSDSTELGVEDLPEEIRRGGPGVGSASMFSGDDLSVKRRTAELERDLIKRALERAGGNRTKAADLVELSPRALRYKIQDYGLD